MIRFLNIKYDSCKCIRTIVADPNDWARQPRETIRDIDGYPIMEVYKDYCKCSVCQNKEQVAVR